MPKVSLTINDFSGGLNTDISPRDLEGNQLEVCTNVDPSSVGRLKMASQFKDADTDIQGGNNDFTSAAHTTPGYGLFVFSNDNEVQTQSDGTHSANADDFLLKADGTTVDVQELSDGTITADQLGTTSATPAFYAAEGDVFVGGDHGTAPSSLVWHYQAKRDRTVADWLPAGQAKTPPTNGVNGNMRIHESLANNDGSSNANTEFNVSGGGGSGSIANIADGLHWVVVYGADESGGWNNDSTSPATGDFVEFGASWLYKNKAESAITTLDSGDTMENNGGTNEQINTTLTVHAYVSEDYTSATDNLYGARLYSRQNGENTWYLLAELSFEDGIKGSLETEFNEWKDRNASYGHTLEATGAMCTTNPITDPPALLTFDSLNGYETDDIAGIVYWKHGTVANSRAYVANVKVNGRVYGDRILKSPIFQYDVFTENAFIDVAINDGDSITALESYADRLLEFKKKSLYIINISKELEFLEDVRIGAGVDNPTAVAKTSYGVVWANQTGCFLYDGEQLSQLNMGKISDFEWNRDITENVIVGFDLPSRQVIVLWNGAAAGSGQAYVYTLDTQSWHKVDDMMVHESNVTNMVNTSSGKLLIGGGDAGNSEVYVYDARTADTSNFSMRTGHLSLGNPGSKKNLLNVKVRYKNSGSALNVKVIVDDAAASIGEDTITLGTLTNNTGGSLVTKEFNTAATTTLKGQYWFAIQIIDEDGTGTTHKSFEIDEIVLTYRELGVR
tara:strand:- start:7682 stop:9880 length:2199 start_codon:yes stop_codon:yes gene_type:complete